MYINKIRLAGYILAFLFSLCLCCGGLIAQTKKDEKPESARKKSDLYLRAPDVVPGTLPEMREVSYWLEKIQNPDQVVLSIEQIEDRNRNYRRFLSHNSLFDSTLTQQINKQLRDRPGLLIEIPIVKSLGNKELSALVEGMVKSQTDYLRSREFGNIMSIQYSAQELNEIEEEISFYPQQLEESPRAATIVELSQLKIIPAIKPEHIGLFTKGKARWDLWNLDILSTGTPVQVLYTSKSAAFLLVLSERGYGWVSSEAIAFNADDETDAFFKTSDFIVCAGDRVPYYADSNCTLFLGWMQMGDRLPLAMNNQRSVKIPRRTMRGILTIETAWFKPDADISLGYLPYTRKNVIEQVFSLLDNLYDWTGAWYGRNHVTALRDIFSCFGFDLPANGILLSAFGERSRRVFASEGRGAQLGAIFSSEPFLTLQICENSHSQLYLGNYDGMPIVGDAHGYGYRDGEGEEFELKRWVIGTMEMPDYFLKQDITFVDLH